MTQEAPETTPVSSPEPNASQHLAGFWNSLSKNAKIAIGVAVLVLVIIIASSGGGSNPTPTTSPVDTTPTTISLSEQWSSWKASIVPVISQTQSDYTQTQADLSNSDLAASTQDFATLAQDATNIAGLANSPDTTINNDVITVSATLNSLASAGLNGLSSGDITPFTSAVNAYNDAVSKLTADLDTANNTYA
jgi:hypothetical protein